MGKSLTVAVLQEVLTNLSQGQCHTRKPNVIVRVGHSRSCAQLTEPQISVNPQGLDRKSLRSSGKSLRSSSDLCLRQKAAIY